MADHDTDRRSLPLLSESTPATALATNRNHARLPDPGHRHRDLSLEFGAIAALGAELLRKRYALLAFATARAPQSADTAASDPESPVLTAPAVHRDRGRHRVAVRVHRGRARRGRTLLLEATPAEAGAAFRAALDDWATVRTGPEVPRGYVPTEAELAASARSLIRVDYDNGGELLTHQPIGPDVAVLSDELECSISDDDGCALLVPVAAAPGWTLPRLTF
ncbi:hypothetical protein [Rhodococcus jostii]|uniref:Uncharacterized protein n=1 Tax=Rhodococcus jostii TaxID=132919 RepID=A0A1H4SB52_RHOJO|nr:hypothetical protein [Rhodococcus jostii]SEC41091.1 hypothetical protein SAMN04490220_1567 [Rhodococcus jostii]